MTTPSPLAALISAARGLIAVLAARGCSFENPLPGEYDSLAMALAALPANAADCVLVPAALLEEAARSISVWAGVSHSEYGPSTAVEESRDLAKRLRAVGGEGEKHVHGI